MVQDDKGKDKKIILFNRKMKLNNKFIFIKSFIVVDMADFNVVTFPSDITVTIKFNGNFKNNHLQAIIEKIWFEGDFIWLDNGYNLIS